jgi:hypothetical protein
MEFPNFLQNKKYDLQHVFSEKYFERHNGQYRTFIDS